MPRARIPLDDDELETILIIARNEQSGRITGLTKDQATLLLDIASAQEMPHVLVRYARDRDADARALERLGLVERHYIGRHYGAFATKNGSALLDGLKEALSTK